MYNKLFGQVLLHFYGTSHKSTRAIRHLHSSRGLFDTGSKTIFLPNDRWLQIITQCIIVLSCKFQTRQRPLVFANAQFQLSSGGKLKLQLFNNSTRGGKRISFDEGKIFPFNKIFLPLATGRLRLLEMLLCVPCSVFSFGVLTGGVIRHF